MESENSKKNIRKSEDAVSHGRRKFFGTVAIGAAGSVVAAALPNAAPAQTVVASNASAAAADAQAVASEPAIIGPPSTVLAFDEIGPIAKNASDYVGKTGSDFMVDVIKTLNFDYCAVLPGSTFRALQESLINYGDNKTPELITCTNEDIAASMAHGYAKMANKPMMALVHGVVGLQHASMSIYNAWCDRAPMVVVVGNTLDAAGRAPAGAEWDHSAQDNAALVRAFTKWDDQPASLESFAMSMVRAQNITSTIPYAPTLIVADNEMGEAAMPGPDPFIPPSILNTPPVGDPASVLAAAKMLVAAEQPVILADRMVRTQAGMDSLVELAEALGAPVIDLASRLNMPTRHPLNLSWAGDGLLAKADIVLALEPVDLFGALYKYRDAPHRTFTAILPPHAKLVTIGTQDLLMHANFQEFGRYQSVDLPISGDGENTLPLLVEAVKQLMPSPAAYAARAAKMKALSDAMHARIRQNATYGWNDSPISVPRICAELGYLIKDDDWTLVTPQDFLSFWPSKLWDFNKHYQFKGKQGGAGVGYEPGASLGAGLANRDAGGRLTVAIIGDGTMMMHPGAMWTAAHHKIPVLWVMHNNRGWHQELMHVQRMADRHSRGVSRAVIGTTMTNPDINFARVADGFGVWSAGPVTDPEMLKPTLQQALDVVRSGHPALVDVVSQGR
jgi:acetolactate synthase I/II/III large subunit